MPNFKVKADTKTKTPSNDVVKLDHRSHIYKLTDSYIGSDEKTSEEIWLLSQNDSSDNIQKKMATYIPGQYKIFDEILVNAFDQHIRTSLDKKCSYPVKTIKINIDKDSGRITVINDGIGIDISIHPKEQVYIPELIFGHLLTSTNYSNNKVKHVGGRNGYGSKLTNIFSKEFTLETVDFKLQKKYKQTWTNNMIDKTKPSITKYTSNPYTSISFIPDYQRFKSDGLTDDMFNIMKRRAYDLAACTSTGVSIYFNNEKINCKNLEDYSKLCIKTPYIYEKVNSRWEIVLGINPFQEHEQISFVNGIFTSKGGKHVDYILNQVSKKLIEYISKKRKITIKPSLVKENIILFLKATIDNPTFNTQTKEYMTTNKDKFGSECIITDKLINAFAKTGIVDKLVEIATLRDNKLAKKNDGKKNNRVKDLPKLEDANFAGHKTKSKECTLILTEGDSAKATAMAGLAIVGRDRYGVFPLKGKMLNIKDPKNSKKILDNSEINSIKKAMGLVSNKKYTSTCELRYGKIMVLADQDQDGTHIKGLLFNIFHSLWPSLYTYEGFLTSMLTPVIKAKKGKKTLQFYSVQDYEKWFKTVGNGWSIKYYKGLGTSTPAEAKEYFKQMKLVNYNTGEISIDDPINLAFGRADDSTTKRKEWLKLYDKNNTLDYSAKDVSINDFVNKDLIHFSVSDNIRSIPSVVDGLKPSQRKVLYCCFKRKLEKEIRVAQLAGYVSENGAYHHGEASLQGTIVNIAQDFVGSNNINLLEPIGQFGTRLSGGKDCAQARYIHTKLSPITYKIFDTKDNPIYDYTEDDGLLVEPVYYVPTLPMLLVNGTSGIGTGWSTEIPSFNPTDIIKNIKNLLNGREYEEMMPYYRNFKGTIEHATDTNGTILDNTFKTNGKYTIEGTKTGDKLTITELPVGIWTDTYKEYLEKLMNDKKSIKYYNSYCTDVDVHFEIFLTDQLQYSPAKLLEKTFKLSNTINCKNMVAFDSNGKLRKYKTVKEIIEEYISVRKEHYNKRKSYILEKLLQTIDLNKYKMRFITQFIEKEIEIMKKTKKEIETQLFNNKYVKIDDSYDYLLKMPIYNLTLEKIEELTNFIDKKQQEHDILELKTIEQLWLDDLSDVEKCDEIKNSSKKFKFVVKK